MSELRLYNSITKKIEVFQPIEKNKIRIYICGPTVYDSPHIGHARTYISFDIIRRILSDYFKYDLTFVMNITNIDDKIIKRAAEKNISCEELGAIYEKEFFDEMDKLNVLRPDFITRVTEYVPEIVRFIEKLEEKGLTYESNGSVYFNLKVYRESFSYNIFRSFTKLETNAETEEKNSREDFVLWKASKDGDPSYASPWGHGRPGWHIECSVMSTEVLGDKLDIHAGGIDLAFPHHENEVAQCQGYFGSPWGQYFLHTGHLNINGLKMSKSLKNFLTIKDILGLSSANHLRILFIQHFWNKDMNYDADQLKEAGAILKKLSNFISNAESLVRRNDVRSMNALDRKYFVLLDETKSSIDEAFKNNIDTPKALSLMLSLISEVNNDIKIIHTDILSGILNFIKRISGVFGIVWAGSKQEDGKGEEIAQLLADFRNKIKISLKAKNEAKDYFKLCDEAREKLRDFGFIIDDLPDGPILRKSN